MINKEVPFSLTALLKPGKTPFYIYDETKISSQIEKLNQAFSRFDFKEFFAVKATPNPVILKLLKEHSSGVDCSSYTELILAEMSGYSGEEIMFTSNDTTIEEFKKAIELGAIINLDDINHLEYIESYTNLPELISFRYNPGNRTGNSIIGNPAESKFGVTREQIFEGYMLAKKKGIKRFGLHTMVCSNELNPDYFVETARMMFELIVEINNKTGICIEFVNLGGGFGIPYKPEDSELDINYIADKIYNLYIEIIEKNNLDPIKLFMENGRYITGESGYLITKVLHKKETYKTYIGIDANMSNLMRPALYGSYHHISVLNESTSVIKCDVVGSLCENNDKFAIDREIPDVSPGDLIVIHDTGAHGYSMGFNYNGKLRCAEYLYTKNNEMKLIRRAETVQDYLSTLEV